MALILKYTASPYSGEIMFIIAPRGLLQVFLRVSMVGFMKKDSSKFGFTMIFGIDAHHIHEQTENQSRNQNNIISHRWDRH